MVAGLGKAAAGVALVVAAAIAAPDDAWAGKRGGGSRSGARSGTAHHHHHHHGSFHSAFLFWSPWWYGPYYYPYPPAVAYVEPAAPIYVEQYVGEPIPGTTDVIYCPNRGAYYPDATDCPGGWARVVQ